VPSREYTGEELGAGVCVIVVDAPPGGGPSLHQHPYEEVFVVHEGEATFRMGDEERVVRGGEVVVVPPDTPHAFTNTGNGPLKQVDIHVSPRFVTEWLDDERAIRPAQADRAP
jgi:mannose-6-phosphate isomerase-like protein (cupin superfamily)